MLRIKRDKYVKYLTPREHLQTLGVMKACRLGNTRGTHTWAEGGQEPEATLLECREVGWVRGATLRALFGTRLVFKWEVLYPGNPLRLRHFGGLLTLLS